MNFSKTEYGNRLANIKRSMQEKGIDLLISQDTSNINYITYGNPSTTNEDIALFNYDSEQVLTFNHGEWNLISFNVIDINKNTIKTGKINS